MYIHYTKDDIIKNLSILRVKKYNDFLRHKFLLIMLVQMNEKFSYSVALPPQTTYICGENPRIYVRQTSHDEGRDVCLFQRVNFPNQTLQEYFY